MCDHAVDVDQYQLVNHHFRSLIMEITGVVIQEESV